MAKQWSEYMENNKKEVCEICGSEAIEVYECEMCGAMICDKCQAPYDQFIQIDFNCCADCGKYNPYDN